MDSHERYMSRCIQLAKLGAGNVAPNPMVGAILVYEDKIIGEGYHKKFGESHAEVNCIRNVPEKNKSLIEKSTMYVTLEPCSHYGKTPPCSNLIIQHKIKRVIIGCIDIYKEVSGKGIEQLQNSGVEVIKGVLESECYNLNKRFFNFHQNKRPYIILKWAQSTNGKIGSLDQRILISNEYTNRVVHKWRTEESAILVGTNTVLKDDPSLTTRLWQGKNPLRIVIDNKLMLPSDRKVFNHEANSIIINLLRSSIEGNLHFLQLGNIEYLEEMLHAFYKINIQSILVEGGAKTLQTFIEGGLWNEARVITNGKKIIEDGVNAPEMKNFKFKKEVKYFEDIIQYYEKC